jgi:hypothetical protein
VPPHSLVHHELTILDLAEGSEVLQQRLLGRLPADTADEDATLQELLLGCTRRRQKERETDGQAREGEGSTHGRTASRAALSIKFAQFWLEQSTNTSMFPGE